MVDIEPTITSMLTVRNPLRAIQFYKDAFGARLIFPIADQPYGYRQGRIEDPFGHQWLIGRPLE